VEVKNNKTKRTTMKKADRLIRQLTSIKGLKVICPCCAGEPFLISRAKLFSAYETYPPAALKIVQARREVAVEGIKNADQRTKQLLLNRKRKPEKITISTQATNLGQQCEQIVPAFTTFPYAQRDCRPLFKPVDYIHFAGVSTKGRVEAIKLIEFKTGNGRLTKQQTQIRDCIGGGDVSHEVIGQANE
jgi:predicted Holliday junction resolvase-like endonuclease